VRHAGLHPEAGADEHIFIGRLRSLPERLVSHLASFDQTDAITQVKMVLAISPFMQKLRDSLPTGELTRHEIDRRGGGESHAR